MDLVEPFRFGIPGLEVVIGDGPGGRDPIDVVQFAEVLRRSGRSFDGLAHNGKQVVNARRGEGREARKAKDTHAL